jgi:hypothetical protein
MPNASSDLKKFLHIFDEGKKKDKYADSLG